MSHAEVCRRRFEAIEKRKLDKQLEEATRNAEPPPVSTVKMEVEQPQEQPSTVVLDWRRLVRRRYSCQVPVLTRCGWRSLSRPAARGHVLENMIDHMQQRDTDIPSVWRCQVEAKSDLNGDRAGKLMDPEKVVKGRLTEHE